MFEELMENNLIEPQQIIQQFLLNHNVGKLLEDNTSFIVLE
jgi:hypothetical protein